MAIKIGVGFFVTAYTVDAATVASAAEAAGFESIWVPDHPVLPVHPSIPYPFTADGKFPLTYGEMADPFVLLSFMAGATSTIRLGTGVALVSERHPLITAKLVSTLDNFSGGRLLFGIGTGGIPNDLEMYGVRFDRKWAYTREAILSMRALWRDGTASFSGKYVAFPEVRCDPMPLQRPWPPILVGAAASDRTFKRVAEFGDEWMPPSGITPQQVEVGRKELDARCREVGRDPASVGITVFYAMDVSAPIRRMYEEAGASRMVVQLYNHPGHAIPLEGWRDARIETLNGRRPPKDETMQRLEWLAESAGL